MKFEDYIYSDGVLMSHRHRVSPDDVMGCFQCCDTFLGEEIEEWINENKFGGFGETAICPHCGIDSVVRVEDILTELCRRQFGREPDNAIE